MINQEAISKVLIKEPELYLSKNKPQDIGKRKIIHTPKELAKYMSNKLPFKKLLEEANTDAELESLSQKLLANTKSSKHEIVIDDSNFPHISSDRMIINIGLIIFRFPIFFHMDKYEHDWIWERNRYDSKHAIDRSQYYEQCKLLLGNKEELNKYVFESQTHHPDNKPTHETNANGYKQQYSFASKYFQCVDPNISDTHCVQYAGDYRAYFIVKNKITKKWQFPYKIASLDGDLNHTKINLFKSISKDEWKIRYFPIPPVLCIKQEFTQSEKSLEENFLMNGYRTYYMLAAHDEGMTTNHNADYEDYAWVPKIELQKYFTEEDYNSFIKVMISR